MIYTPVYYYYSLATAEMPKEKTPIRKLKKRKRESEGDGIPRAKLVRVESSDDPGSIQQSFIECSIL